MVLVISILFTKLAPENIHTQYTKNIPKISNCKLRKYKLFVNIKSICDCYVVNNIHHSVHSFLRRGQLVTFGMLVGLSLKK